MGVEERPVHVWPAGKTKKAKRDTTRLVECICSLNLT